jgi:hypothetical protein
MHTLDQLARLDLALGDSTGADSSVVVFVIDAAHTAEFLVTLLLPLGDEGCVGPLFH